MALPELPTGWAWATLGEISESVRNGIFVSRPTTEPDGVPILRIGAVRPLRLDLSDLRFSGKSEHELRTADKLVLPGDLLFTRYNGNPELVGSCTSVPESVPVLTYPDKLIRVRLDQRVALPEFVAYAFSWKETRSRVRGHVKTTAGQVGIAGGELKAIHLPIPPIPEQQRIVAALEQQFSRLTLAAGSLCAAQRKAASLQQSIYDYAASGGIADDWPGIPNLVDAENLRNGWTWKTPAELTDGSKESIVIGPFGSNLKVSDYEESGVPLVFVRNIRSTNFKSTKYVSRQKAEELKSHTVMPGDLLITKMGDPPGDAAAYHEQENGIITADCIRLRPAAGWDVDYLAMAVNSTQVRKQVEAATRGVAQRKVSLARFRSEIRIPVPPRHIQGRVVEEADDQLSGLGRLQRALARAEGQAEALRGSLLSDAFRGALVAQEPSDEPTRLRLERVRAEGAAQRGEGSRRVSQPSAVRRNPSSKSTSAMAAPPPPDKSPDLAATQPTLDMEIPS